MARIKGVTESEANDEVPEFLNIEETSWLCVKRCGMLLPLGRRSRKESRYPPKEFRNQDSSPQSYNATWSA